MCTDPWRDPVSLDRGPTHVGLLTGADLRQGAPGGTRAYVLGLAHFLTKEGIDVEILSNGPVDEAPSSCRVVPICENHTPLTRRFQDALRRWDPSGALDGIDILHIQRPDDLRYLAGRFNLPPVVCTLHGNPAKGILRRRGRLVAYAYRFVEARMMRRIQAILAVDRQTTADYRRRYPSVADRIEWVPNAIGDEWITGSEAFGLEVPHDSPPTLLFVGRLSVEKRVDRIIEAMSVSSVLARGRLLLAGTGPDEGRLRRLADGLHVEFLANVSRKDLPSLYRRADALVLASEYEGFPAVVLEALASGCLVVATANPDIETLLRDGRGIVVYDPAELPSALEEAVAQRHRGARASLPKEFTWSNVGPRVLSVYRRVLQEVAS